MMTKTLFLLLEKKILEVFDWHWFDRSRGGFFFQFWNDDQEAGFSEQDMLTRTQIKGVWGGRSCTTEVSILIKIPSESMSRK